MKVAIMLNATIDWAETDRHGYQLVKSFLNNGHVISGVFLYGKSVYITNNPNTSKKWQKLTEANHVPLIICSTMVEQYNLNQIASNSHLKIAGMAAWVKWSETADKVMELT